MVGLALIVVLLAVGLVLGYRGMVRASSAPMAASVMVVVLLVGTAVWLLDNVAF